MGSLEPPNFLAEETTLNQNRFHFCKQKIVEIRKRREETAADEYLIGLPSIEKHCLENAALFNIKVVQREGKIQKPDQICLSIYDRSPLADYAGEGKGMLSDISIKCKLSAIFVEFSFETMLYIDKILMVSL